MNRTFQHIIFILILFPQVAFLQNFAAVDEYARNAPASKASSIEKLAPYLTAEFSSEEEKIRAIYVWMAENIRYAITTASNSSMSVEQRLKRQEPDRVLRSKRAVCEGYSNLFVALCEAAGLSSFIVTGYTKLPNGKIAPVGHAWNMVRVEGIWHLLDATWGAGGVDGSNGRYVKSLSDEFFLADPKQFIQLHLPHDPLFQLLPQAVSYEVFKNSETVLVTDDRLNEDLNEKLDQFYESNSEERLLATSIRAVEFDPENGFANFTLSKHYYELALGFYQLFYQDSQKAFDKKLPLTTPMVNGWEEHLEDYRANLKISEKYLVNIRPGDPVAEAARISKSALKQAWKVSRETDKQFQEYRRYLTKTGR